MIVELRRDDPEPPAVVRCDECGTILFEVRGDTLIVKARHHGEVHVTVVSLADLLQRAA